MSKEPKSDLAALKKTAAPAKPCAFIIFGATGDLTKRLLMPALYNLASGKLLDDQFSILGIGRKADSNGSEQWRLRMYRVSSCWLKCLPTGNRRKQRQEPGTPHWATVSRGSSTGSATCSAMMFSRVMLKDGSYTVPNRLDAKVAGKVGLHLYPASSNGPAAADELLIRDGRHWPTIN